MITIVPPYLAARARVGVIFAREIQHAEEQCNSPLVAVLEALRGEVLAAIDPEAVGGDAHSTSP